MNKRIVISITLALLLVPGLLMATGTGEATSTAGTEEPTVLSPGQRSWEVDTSPATIDLYVDYSWFRVNWDDPTAERVTDATGVSLNISKPVSDDAQKLSLMIASGSLPDMVVTGLGNPFKDTMIGGDLVYSLDDLSDRFAPDFWDYVQPEIRSSYQAADGNLYYYATSVHTAAYVDAMLEYNALISAGDMALAVRLDYWEEIGKPDMSTPQSFIAAIEAMKENHPDKIGFLVADGRFYGSNLLPFLWGPGRQFGVQYNYYVDESDDRVYKTIRDPRLLEAILWLNTMVNKGLFTTDSFVDSTEIQTAKINSGDVISYAWSLGRTEIVPADNSNTHYTAIDPFPSYEVVKSGDGWNATMITKNAELPDRAIRLLAYFVSEFGHEAVQWGVKGNAFGNVIDGPHYYLDESGKPTYFSEYVTAKEADWDGIAARNGLGEYWFGQDRYLWELPFIQPSDAFYDHFNQVMGPKVEYNYALMNVTVPGDSEEGVIAAQINQLFIDQADDMIFADDNVAARAAYQDFLSRAEELGLSRVEEAWTEQYRANKARMGL